MKVSDALRLILLSLLAAEAAQQPLNDEFSQTIPDLEAKYKRILDEQMKNLLPFAFTAVSEVELSAECLNAGMKILRSVRELKTWSVQMLDASGKIPAGLFEGTSTELGDYDECLSIRSDEEVSGQPITGQYCLATVALPPVLRLKSKREFGNYSTIQELEKTDSILGNFLKLRDMGRYFAGRIGFCTPSVCSENDTRNFLNYVFKPMEFKTSAVRCETAKPQDWTLDQIIITSILSTILLISLVATLMDMISGNTSSATFNAIKDESANRCSSLKWCLMSFSILANCKKVFEDQKSSHLSILKGIRVLTIIWIILGHTYFFPAMPFFYRIHRLKNVVEMSQSAYFLPVANPSSAVDTFFVISGLLIAHINGPKLSTSGVFQMAIFICRRIIRIIPAMALTIGLFILLPLFGTGPLWNETVGQNVQVCRATWWRNILFVHNFWSIEETCLFHTWFLSAFFQLTILGMFFTIFLYKKPLFGSLLLVLVTLTSCIVVGLLNSYVYDYSPTMSFTVPNPENWQENISHIYFPFYTHLGPFCIGLLVGYFLQVKYKIRLTKLVLIIGWLLCLGGMVSIIYGLYNFSDLYTGWTYRLLSGLYAGFHRTLWGLCVSWICVVCVSGYGGHVTRFLSWSVFAILDKLTFFVYLFHPLIMFYYHGVARERHIYGGVEMFISFLGFTLLSFGMAFFAHVIVEQPINSLDSFLFRRKTHNASNHDVQVITVHPIVHNDGSAFK